MSSPGVIYGRIPTDQVSLSPGEIRARLGKELPTELYGSALSQLQQAVVYRYAWTETGVTFPEENVCAFDFATVESQNLYRNLQSCSRVLLLAVTVGPAVDRILAATSVRSGAMFYVLDGLASAAVESLCDRVQEDIAAGRACCPRFSPGYGDLPLTFQEALLQRLDAGKSVGITLNDAFFMRPSKSITAIVGIKP